MRAVKAKKIRKIAYGDLSMKAERLYVGKQHIKGVAGKPGTSVHLWEIRNSPTEPRRRYQDMKTAVKKETFMALVGLSLAGMKMMRIAMRTRDRKRKARAARRIRERLNLKKP